MVQPEALLADDLSVTGFKVADETLGVKALANSLPPDVGETGGMTIGADIMLQSAITPVKSNPSGTRRMATDKWKSKAAL